MICFCLMLSACAPSQHHAQQRVQPSASSTPGAQRTLIPAGSSARRSTIEPNVSTGMRGKARSCRPHVFDELRLKPPLRRERQAVANAAPAATHTYYRNVVVVLTYHDVARRVQAETDTVSPEQFAAQIARLQQGGFHFISLSKLQAFLSEGAAVPSNAVCLVFDNGYRGIYRYAFPLLRRQRIPATVFLIVSYVDRLENDLTWTEIASMSHSGVFRFGTETYNLHRAVAIDAAGDTTAATVGRALLADGQPETLAHYRRRVLRDLSRARRIVEAKTGQAVDTMVYPYGQYTPTLVSLAHQAGYRYLFTTLGWVLTPGANPDRLTRLDVGVWNETPTEVVNAILTVVRDASRGSYTPPRRYVTVWR